jgi:murein DD-endopeptidase MepM/ murein hydrolase activator NlpD
MYKLEILFSIIFQSSSMKHICKKLLLITIILSLSISPLAPLPAVAATSPDQPSLLAQAPEITGTITPSGETIMDTEETYTETQATQLIKKALQTLITTTQTPLFSNKHKPIKVRQLNKKTFRSSEKIPITIENDDADKVKIEVFNYNGAQVDVAVSKISTSDPAIVSIAPPSYFKPGRYRLKVTDSQGTISTQDFTWGVLAINTNKSIYQQGNVAQLQMAVLDELGNMVCDASLHLSIKTPQEQSAEYSTKDGTIKVNPECEKKEYTTVPDFETTYMVNGGEGFYEMVLTAQTKNGTYTINDQFQVKNDVAFDVERHTNTRIYPPVRYPVKMDIIAQQDFTGEISEVVPYNFDIELMENMLPFNVSLRVQEQTVDKPPVSDLGLPFAGQYDLTQGFGEDETDPLLAEKYHKYGVVGHDGLDYALPMRTPVLAVDEGTIVRAQEKGDYGTTIIIQHSWGRSYYGHLSKMDKKQGEKIKKGQQLGLSGNTGLSTGPHLHFGVKLNENDDDNGYYGKINPRPFLAGENANMTSQVAGIATSSAILRTTTEDNVQILTWKVNVKKGDKIQLGYTYLAPAQSPEFYTLGPLEFVASTSATPVFKEARKWKIAADAVANNGLFTYADMADTDNTNAKTYTDPTTLGTEYTTVNPAGVTGIANVKVVRSPTREEAVMAQQLRNGILNIYSCTTGCDASGDWTHIATQSAVTTDAGSETFRPWDIAYEQISGLFTVVFYESGDTGDLHYCQWDGTDWTPATECDNGGTRPAAFAPGAGNAISYAVTVGNTVAEWVRLVPKGERLTQYRSDEFLLGMADAGDDLLLAHWSGSAWEDLANPSDAMSAQNAQKFDIAWEETTGEGLAVPTAAAVANLQYVTYTNGAWDAIQSSAEANNGGQAFNSWVSMANDPITDDVAIIVADSGADIELFHWDGTTLQDFDAIDDTAAEANTGDHAEVQWTRFTSEAVYMYTDANVLTSDMQCWQTGGGNFTAAVLGDVGNPNISNGDDAEDANLVASPNNDRMLMSRRSVDTAATTGDDIDVLTYDGAGCADADWATVGQLTGAGEGLNTANTIMKVHSEAYTPYSPWSLNWRFFDDETADNPATGLNGAAENVAPTDIDQEEFIRLRMNTAERGGMGQSDTRKILQYTSGCDPNTSGGESSCTWTDVGDTSETSAVWRYATTGETCAACSDGGTSTTSRLTGTNQGSPSVFYVADKNAAADTDFDHTALLVREIDFPLKAEDVTEGTTYYFRLYEPRISSNGQDSPVWREQDDDGNNDCASTTCTYPSLTIAEPIQPGTQCAIRIAPSFPDSANLTEGSGARGFSAVTTQAGDYLVVEAVVENGLDPDSDITPSGGGLTYTPQNDVSGDFDDVRVYQWTALDSTGGSRTVTLTPTGTLDYYGRLTVVRGSDGPANTTSSSTGQTVSASWTDKKSTMFMTVGDWSAGSVGSPTWIPSGSTTASQQGSGATYIFGRLDSTGAAGTATHGISSPSYTTPSIAILEMLGTDGIENITLDKLMRHGQSFCGETKQPFTF